MKPSIESLFNPTGVAIIGASRREGSVGRAALDNLIEAGFSGGIYPVNPSADKISGKKCYSSILEIPSPVDLAVIAVPARFVPQVLEDCGKKEVSVVVVITAGFKEIGPEGAKAERQIKEIAERYGIRILGPNTLGMISTPSMVNVSFASQIPLPGKIAFASQSGAFCTSILDWSRSRGIGFSKFVSLGNKVEGVGIDEIDLMEAWKDDPDTSVILMYLEQITDGQRFMRVAREVTPVKPIIIAKSGTSDAGAKAAASHTGSLAGSDQAYTAAFEQVGVTRAADGQELFDLAAAFASVPVPDGENVALVTNAGGPGIMATDAVEKSGLSLADFSAKTIERLMEKLPPTANFHNPVDVIGDAKADRYKDSLEILVQDPGVDSIIVILTPQAMTESIKTAQVTTEIAKSTNKPILASWMGGEEVEEGFEYLMKEGVPCFPFPERAAFTMAGLVKHKKRIERVQVALLEKKTSEETLNLARGIFQSIRDDNRVVLTEDEAKRVVAAYGVPVGKEILATSPDGAAQAAAEIGFPVVMKIVSPQILHKTDVGGVKLGINSIEAAYNAYQEIITSVTKAHARATLKGVLVAQQVPPGKEIIIGMVSDPQFGPLLMFGLGGIYVEVLKDVTFRVAPLSKEHAYSMIESIRAYSLLTGVRGEEATDIKSLVDTLLKISQLSLDFPEIVELDINPLFAYERGKGSIALDVKMTLKHE